jgi:hypothetical protein
MLVKHHIGATPHRAAVRRWANGLLADGAAETSGELCHVVLLRSAHWPSVSLVRSWHRAANLRCPRIDRG